MTRSFGPLLEVARIQSEINRLFDNLLDLGAGEGKEGGAWTPRRLLWGVHPGSSDSLILT